MFHYPLRPNFAQHYMQEMHELRARRLSELLDGVACPIGSNVHLYPPARNGVVKIENIPYAVTRQEVFQFFGRYANLAENFPVHVLMERSTGKTMDCYVEFSSHGDAVEAVRRAYHNLDIGQSPRLGVRHVDVSLSSQDELMKALFPLAKRIQWVGGRPILAPSPEDEPWSTGFTGFLTEEELFCTLRHAEQPHRSAYSTKVPQRTYESIISTISKYPWGATNMYTVTERNRLFRTLRFMVQTLIQILRYENIVGLDQRLISEMVMAGLRCPAFNPRMKFCLAYVGRQEQILQRMSEEMMLFFPFDTLTWLPPFDTVALEFYASLMAQGDASWPEEMGLDNHWRDPRLLEPYGRYWFEWNEAEMPENLKFSDCIERESRIFRGLLTSGHQVVHQDNESGSTTPTPRHQQAYAPRSRSGSVVWSPQTPGPITTSPQLPYIGQTGELNPLWTFPRPSTHPYPATSQAGNAPGLGPSHPSLPRRPPRPPRPSNWGFGYQ
ncbi:Nucleotide-binding alpha-beta plait [Penicillium hispanicum]|uniref:Nucleotide-binding alpha-beta plait n=1 Tax=Penicillium hispanicum TaxID=1080232 RepID=UPI002541A56D|nr:Nucleotide-binding alpha-beta plait [Penicillium hispanicum]KAJ5595544.1 Nucleotide-binding alpha-beta plait [Penicillium hispanicum]